MDNYVKERWGQFQTDITKEFNTIVDIHKAMQSFKVNIDRLTLLIGKTHFG
jgi:hypothetical protein